MSVDAAMARRNKQILAERLGWPDGALAACEDLEDRHPGWHVSWLGECTNKDFERPAGYWATCDEFHHVEIFREDLGELAEVMAGVPEHVWSTRTRAAVCMWCLTHSASRRAKL